MEEKTTPAIDGDNMTDTRQSESMTSHPREEMSNLTWVLVLVGLYLGAILYGQ